MDVQTMDLVLGYLSAWAVSKAHRAADRKADQVMDHGLDQLYDLVDSKLGVDPALAKIETEVAASGTVTNRTKQRVQLSLAEAAEQYPAFADEVSALVWELEGLKTASVVAAASGHQSTVVARDVNMKAETSGVVGWNVGTVNQGPPNPPIPATPHG